MSKDRKPARETSPCVGTATRKASRRLTQLYDNALSPCGLRSTQSQSWPSSIAGRWSRRPGQLLVPAGRALARLNRDDRNFLPSCLDGAWALKKAKWSLITIVAHLSTS